MSIERPALVFKLMAFSSFFTALLFAVLGTLIARPPSRPLLSPEQLGLLPEGLGLAAFFLILGSHALRLYSAQKNESLSQGRLLVEAILLALRQGGIFLAFIVTILTADALWIQSLALVEMAASFAFFPRF
ncbi:hypothetical protein KAI87_02720 [Myxococcota bacterium]|nr:hypothetical protein [Myxococcota bacterium]